MGKYLPMFWVGRLNVHGPTIRQSPLEQLCHVKLTSLSLSGVSNSASVIWSNLGRPVLGLSVRRPLLGSASHHPEDLLFRELS